MPLRTQHQKQKLELQPRKVRLRLVQVAPRLMPGAAIAANITATVTLSSTQNMAPGMAGLLGNAAAANVEPVTVLAVNHDTNTVTFANALSQAHTPAAGEFFTPARQPRVTVLGRILTASWEGLNGRSAQGRGFAEGNYTRAIRQEGSFSITLPNGAGTDGVLHRTRFQIITNNDYRLGDEWIEIWASSGPSGAGDLLFVGTPESYTLAQDTLTVTGYDAMYLLKKFRETTVGNWTHSPRDAFEDYTKAVVVAIADGFDNPANLPSAVGVYNLIPSVDGRWSYSGAAASPNPSNVRLTPLSFGSAQAVMNANIAMPIGAGGARQNDRWLITVGFTGPALQATDNIVFGLYSNSVTGGANYLHSILLNGSGVTSPGFARAYNAANTAVLTMPFVAGYQGGYHTLSIEGRGRWVWYSIDGKTVACSPVTDKLYSDAYPAFVWNAVVANQSPSYVVDVDFMIARQAQSFLLRGSDRGDLHLPGAPVQGGLQGTYISDAGIAVAQPNFGLWQFSPAEAPPASQSGSQQGGIYARRVDPAVTFGVAAQMPPGPTTTQSARWTGSIYLDLANFDYCLSTKCSGGSRVWVGLTRLGDQAIDNSVVGGGANGMSANMPVAYSPWLKSGAAGNTPVGPGSSGTLAGRPSGWYPIVCEWQYSQITALRSGANAPAGMQLCYSRSDTPFLRVPINVVPYSHVVMADSPVAYWPLNTPQKGSSANVGFSSWYEPNVLTGGPDINQVYPADALSVDRGYPYVGGALPGDSAFTIAGDSAQNLGVSAALFSTAGWAGVTVEAWVRPTAYPPANTYATLVNKEYLYGVYMAGNGHLYGWVGNGAAWDVGPIDSGYVLPLNAWTHVVMTYAPQSGNLLMWANGVPTPSPSSASHTGQTGAQNTTGLTVGMAAAGQFLVGAIQHIALYSSVLSGAQIRAHYQATSGQVTLNANGAKPVTSQSLVPASPQGIMDSLVRNDAYYEQLRLFDQTWGYQFTLAPMALESGEFPGRLAPRVREGHDTDYIFDSDNSITPVATVHADDVADSLIIDAQGLADPGSSAQLYAEIYNFAELGTGDHLIGCQEYDSPGDINTVQQLQTRGASLLALRTTPWQAIQLKPPGKSELTDTFPLTGNWSEFRHLPGDGFRVVIPEIGVEDIAPRQYYSLAWTFYPDGVAPPDATIQSRPKGLKETLRRINRESLDESRNYQGQLVVINASIGAQYYSAAGVTSGSSAATDQYTRLSLPNDLSTVARVTLIVEYLSISSPATAQIQVNGTNTGLFVTAAGRYDVTPWLAVGAGQQMYACLIWAGANMAGSSTYQVALEALTRV